MKQKVANINEENYRMFSLVAIEIAARCNRHCEFCPNAYYTRPDDYMSEEMFVKIVEELKELKFKGRVEFYIYNEPTRDKRLPEFIAYVREHLPSTCMMINTNGDYFKSAADIKNLFDLGLNQMQINIYSTGESEKQIEHAKKREVQINAMVEEVRKEIDFIDASIYKHIGAKNKAIIVVPKYNITKAESKEYHDSVNHISNRAGNIPGYLDSLTEPLKKVCTRPFRHLLINWTGDVILCCHDFFGEANFGNVNKQSLIDIWNAYELNVYRLKLQNKQRDIFLCDKCDFNGGSFAHEIRNVTFGEENDAAILSSSVLNRDDIFKNLPTIIKP